MLDEGAFLPTKAHENDAGWDLYSKEDGDVRLWNGSSYVFDTGVHIQIPPGFVGMIKSRSGMNFNYGLQAEGVVDADYLGSIKVKLYCNDVGENCCAVVAPGDKIAQLVVMPIAAFGLEPVDSLEPTERGSNGFGSSGR
ncbi:MAG: dUTP diphosphatase [Candidatus Gastranaerophilales bacterium]|nr:dUTP diphosphatase [Candidatus Gastranaerophilales bacterium]